MSTSLQTVTLARQAMATRFEMVLHGENAVALRAAGEEALTEVERLEAQLSLYQPTSEISRLNARAAFEPVRVTPEVFRLLRHAQELWRETAGAFDITIGPLMRCWGFMGGAGHVPDAGALAEARDRVGMNRVTLDEDAWTVRFERPGVMIDLGAIGKGYAVGCAAELLREAGITSALIHGGTSTIHAIGQPPERDAWKVAIEAPPATADAPPRPIAIVPLANEALSVSAVWGKSFQSADKSFGHVIDPRTGQPAHNAVLAAIALTSATDTDALSTALLTVGAPGLPDLARLRPNMRALVLSTDDAGGFRAASQGIHCV